MNIRMIKILSIILVFAMVISIVSGTALASRMAKDQRVTMENETPKSGDETTTTTEPITTENSAATETVVPTKTDEPGATATVEPTKTDEPQATATAEPTKTDEPQATATAEPTKTDEPGATPTPETTETKNIVNASGVKEMDADVKLTFGTDTAGWYRGTYDVNLTTASNNLVATINGSAPIMLNDSVSIPAANHYLVLKMKNNTNASSMNLFFRNASIPAFTGEAVKIFNVTPNDTNMSTYVIDMGTNTKWTDTITNLRFDFFASSGTFTGTAEIESMTFTATKPSTDISDVKLTFGTDTAGWYRGTYDINLTTASNNLVAAINGTTPVMMNDSVSIPAADHYLVLKMKNNTNADSMNLFFRNASIPGYTGEAVKNFTVTPNDTNMSTYVIDMGTNTKWTDTITNLRFDFFAATGTFTGTAEIESMTFTATKPSTDSGDVKITFGSGLAGWNRATYDLDLTTSSNNLVATINGTTPVMMNDSISIPAANRYFILKMKNNTNSNSMDLFFRNASIPAYTGEAVKTFSVTPNDTTMRTYVVDMGTNTKWTDTITNLRFDFFATSGTFSGTAEIESMIFSKTDPTKDATLTTYVLKDNVDKLKVYGRSATLDNGIALDWTASGIAFNTNCKGDIYVNFEYTPASYDPLYLTVYIDGARQSERFAVGYSAGLRIKVASGLSEGNHTIEIYRQSEAQWGRLYAQSIELNGTLLSPPAKKSLMMEFVGDSISSGMSDLTVNGDTSTGTANDDGTQTYAFMTAQRLNADFNVLSQSGLGLVCGQDGLGETGPNFTMPKMYDLTAWHRSRTEAWNFNRTANVVVIELGTNDWACTAKYGLTSADYVSCGKTFVKHIIDKNPGAIVVWITGFMGTQYADESKQVIDELKGEGYKNLYYTTVPYGTLGGYGHPSVANHKAAADKLTPYIQDILAGKDPDAPKNTADKTFDFNTDTEGWYSGGSVVQVSNDTGNLKCSVNGKSPIVLSSTIDIPSEDRYMVIRMKNGTSSTGMRLFYTNDVITSFTGNADVSFAVTANDSDYKTYVVDMGSSSYWYGDIRSLRFDLSVLGDTINGDVLIDSITFTETKPTVAPPSVEDLTYDFSSGTAGWYAGTKDVALSNDGSELAVGIKGSTPIMLSTPIYMNAKNRYMVIKMKNGTGTPSMKMYFTTDSLSSFSGEAVETVTVNPNDKDYTDYIVDMGLCSKWTGVITGFRFDLYSDSTAYNGTTLIKNIRFTATKPTVAPPRVEDLTFDFSSGTAGWYAGTNDLMLSNDGSELVVGIKGSAPIMLSSPIYMNAMNRYMVIKMKNGTGTPSMKMYFTTDSLSSFAGEAVGTVTVNPNDKDFTDYIVDMGLCSKWTGVITGLRFDLYSDSTAYNGTTLIKSIRFTAQNPGGEETQPANGKGYYFTSGTDGWADTTNNCIVGYNNGCLKVDVTGKDPFIMSPSNIELPASYRYMVIKLKNSSPATSMAVYFAPQNPLNINGKDCVTFGVTPNSDFTTYMVDLGCHKDWKDTIYRLRLDLNSNNSNTGTVLIDSIEFLGNCPSYSVKDKVIYDFSKSKCGFDYIHNLSSCKTAGGATVCKINGNDPFILSPYGLGINADVYGKIELKLKMDAPSTNVKLYFVTDKYPKMREEQTTSLTVDEDGYATYIFPANKYWTGTVTQIRLDLNDDSTNSGTVYLKSLEFEKGSAPKAQANSYLTEDGDILFDFSGNTSGWYTGSANCTVKNEGTALNVGINGASPIMLSSKLDFSADNRYMVMKMKNGTGASQMKMLFTTDKSTSFTADACVSFAVTPNDSNYTEYIVDMGANANWKGSIKWLRLDFSGDQAAYNGTTSIESIRFTSKNPVQVNQNNNGNTNNNNPNAAEETKPPETTQSTETTQINTSNLKTASATNQWIIWVIVAIVILLVALGVVAFLKQRAKKQNYLDK